MMTEGKPLTPLTHGSVLIVGTMPSNFGDEIKNHPRVIMWSSQNEHWTSKSLPDNTQAVFITRFIGHAAFDNIVTEARKRKITVFNPNGTGIIAKQVKELLNINPVQTTQKTEEPTEPKEVEMSMVTRNKLKPLMKFVDFSKTNIENARELIVRAKEMKIDTTVESLANSVANLRKKVSGTGVPKSVAKGQSHQVDVSVEILDGMIKELQDMRAFLIATVAENNSLRAKLDNLKKALD